MVANLENEIGFDFATRCAGEKPSVQLSTRLAENICTNKAFSEFATEIANSGENTGERIVSLGASKITTYVRATTCGKETNSSGNAGKTAETGLSMISLPLSDNATSVAKSESHSVNEYGACNRMDDSKEDLPSQSSTSRNQIAPKERKAARNFTEATRIAPGEDSGNEKRKEEILIDNYSGSTTAIVGLESYLGFGYPFAAGKNATLEFSGQAIAIAEPENIEERNNENANEKDAKIERLLEHIDWLESQLQNELRQNVQIAPTAANSTQTTAVVREELATKISSFLLSLESSPGATLVASVKFSAVFAFLGAVVVFDLED